MEMKITSFYEGNKKFLHYLHWIWHVHVVCPVYTDLKHIDIILLRGRMPCHTQKKVIKKEVKKIISLNTSVRKSYKWLNKDCINKDTVDLSNLVRSVSKLAYTVIK